MSQLRTNVAGTSPESNPQPVEPKHPDEMDGDELEAYLRGAIKSPEDLEAFTQGIKAKAEKVFAIPKAEASQPQAQPQPQAQTPTPGKAPKIVATPPPKKRGASPPLQPAPAQGPSPSPTPQPQPQPQPPKKQAPKATTQTVPKQTSGSASAPVHKPPPKAVDLPAIALPRGRQFPEFAFEVGQIIGPTAELFVWQDSVVDVRFEYPQPGVVDRFKLALGGYRITELTPERLVSVLEKHMCFGVQKGKKFKVTNPSNHEMRVLLQTDEFLRQLPHLVRVVTWPIPYKEDFLSHHEPEILQREWNPKYGIWCAPAPKKGTGMPLFVAKKTVEGALSGFEFKDEQSRTHAIAALITPYLRGVIGFEEKVPCWLYEGNRGGSGKDYLEGVRQILYEGASFEDAAIGDNPAETCKRITAGLRAGRRSFHFANCSGHIEDPYLIQAVTNKIWRDRSLGSNDAASDIKVPNEAEISLSFNAGTTFHSDITRRKRTIRLAFYEEDDNARIFPNPEHHEWVRGERGTILDAIHCLYLHWVRQGMPLHNTVFASFNRWAKVVGGVMAACGYGDPCLPEPDNGLIGGDLRTNAMQAVFEHLYETEFKGQPQRWMRKTEVYEAIAQEQENDDRLGYFGDLTNDRTKTEARKKLGMALNTFDARVLSGIKLEIDSSNKKSQQHQLRLTKV